MERYGRAGEEESRSDPSLEWTTSHGGETGVEASMWRLGLGGGGGGRGGGGGGESYPERPDEPDCIYYLRTGACGYGSRCRFNHPRDRGAVIGAVRGETGSLPERMGHPVCQHFMRTGTCKFGASCKYHHPRQGGGGSVAPVSLSYLGYPLRPGEKECSYYMRTGQCKFGLTCRFNHPVPQQQQPLQPQQQQQLQTIYPTLQSQTVPSSHQQYGLVLTRPSLLPGSYLQSHYGPPMVLPPGMVPYSGWNPYQASISAMPSPGTQPSIGSSSVYGITPLSPSATAYTTGTYQSGQPSSNTSKEQQTFPQRPDQPECQYYMRTGDCKFGSSCRYHHPLDAVPPKTNLVLSSIGLPLRPGVAQCTHFAQHGICKFGPACKFDHSMSSSLSYSPSASSLTDMPVAPYPIGSSSLGGALAPVSSSNEPTTRETVTAGLSRVETSGESSGDSASVSGSVEAKTSS